MKKCVKMIKTNKLIIGLNGSTSYIYDLDENLLCTLKDIKSVYNGYVSKNEKVLCLKSTDTFLAFYSLDNFKLINKISLKKCHQPQDQGAVFLDNDKFLNLQYTDALATDIVIYENPNYNEENRYTFDANLVLSKVEQIDKKQLLSGFIRPQKNNFKIDEIKYYIFEFAQGTLNGYKISNREFYLCTNFERDFKYLESVNENNLKTFKLTKEELKLEKPLTLDFLWNKYHNTNYDVILKCLTVK